MQVAKLLRKKQVTAYNKYSSQAPAHQPPGGRSHPESPRGPRLAQPSPAALTLCSEGAEVEADLCHFGSFRTQLIFGPPRIERTP